LLAW
jgi:hypothetical protein